MNVCKLTDAHVEPSVKANQDEMRAIPHVKRQDVEMEALVVSASAKRGSDVADTEERARFPLRVEGKRAQEHVVKDVLGTPGQDEGQANAKEWLEA